MIIETLVDVFLAMLRTSFSMLEFITLPTQTIGYIATFCAYGNWIVGLDIVALFCTTIVFWWGVHMSIGLLVWVWEKLPLT